MTAYLEFWDRVELWLVTLPFAVQLIVMLAIGVPAAVAAAVVVHRPADVLVAAFRAAARSTHDHE